jgi:hypothetical protein
MMRGFNEPFAVELPAPDQVERLPSRDQRVADTEFNPALVFLFVSGACVRLSL